MKRAGLRLFVDIQAIQSLSFGERGIPRYATDLSRALLAHGAPVAGFALDPTLPWPDRLHHDLRRAPALTWNTAASFRRAMDSGQLVYVVTSPFEQRRPVQSVLPPHVLGAPVPIASIVYDLIPDVLGLYDPATSLGRAYNLRRNWLRRADLLLCLSEHTRRDAIERWGIDPRRVAVVGGAASPFFHPPEPGDDPGTALRTGLPAISRPFVLTVSGWHPRKNTETLIDAWARLPRDLRATYQLVVACSLPPEGHRAWTGHAARQGLGPADLVLTDFVDELLLRALYQAASLFVFPSHYEGLGLPVLEAVRSGCPAITSNASSLPEILDDPEATFSPDDADELAQLIDRGLRDQPYRAELVRVGQAANHAHSWERVVDRLLAACEHVPDVRRRGRASRRSSPPRIALVGPFPPSISGIGVCNERLARHLGPHCRLDCFVEPAGATAPVEHTTRRNRPYRLFPARALGRTLTPASYDAVLYTIGNSPFHRVTYQLAQTYPGIVWFHDVNLGGLYLAEVALSHDGEDARQLVRSAMEHYRWRPYYAPPVGDALVDFERHYGEGVYLAAELAAGARAKIVSSQLARAVLELDTGPIAHATPTWVLPLAVPRWRRTGATRRTDVPLVVALGIVHPAKMPENLIAAVAHLRPHRQVRLAFVGEVAGLPEPDAYRARLMQEAAALGVADAVEFVGRADDDEYVDWIERADCAIQLRTKEEASSSAAVNDALALGLPVITNIGACRELPPGTVHLIDYDVCAERLAAELVLLLDDGARRDRLEAGARRYAASWSFEHLAHDVLKIAAERLEPIRPVEAPPVLPPTAFDAGHPVAKRDALLGERSQLARQ